jgi:hypothetical protein
MSNTFAKKILIQACAKCAHWTQSDTAYLRQSSVCMFHSGKQNYRDCISKLTKQADLPKTRTLFLVKKKTHFWNVCCGVLIRERPIPLNYTTQNTENNCQDPQGVLRLYNKRSCISASSYSWLRDPFRFPASLRELAAPNTLQQLCNTLFTNIIAAVSSDNHAIQIQSARKIHNFYLTACSHTVITRQ